MICDRENVKRFLDFARKKSGKGYLITYDRYGDWCVPPATLQEVVTKDSTRMTDGTLIASSYYYYICRLMEKYAFQLGLKKDATYYHQEADSIRAAINRTFLKDGKYANGTVTALLLPSALDIVPAEDNDAVKKNFIERVKGNNDDPHIDCGVIGISWLMRYLNRIGAGDIAYQIASTNTYPSWGYMVENGATTIWELWNGNTANPSMNSGNHVMMLGDLIPWGYECIAGIAPDPECPGFRHVLMKPDFSILSINGVDASFPSIYGLIKSQWKRNKKGKIEWHIELPANTSATLRLPNGKEKNIGSGTYTFTNVLQK